jgi:hypothetical protein
MREALQGKDNPADVINVALEALVGQGCELPSYSMLDRLAGALRAEVNGRFHHLVAGRLDATGRARLGSLLVVDPVTRHSAWPTLTRPAGKATVSRLKQHVAFLAWLDGIGPTGEWLAGLPPAKISHFAGEAAVLDAGELTRVGEDKRRTLLACVVHIARTRARDEVVTMFCKRMAAITSKAKDKLEELREAHRAESERLLGVFGDVLAGVRETLGPTEAEQATATGENMDAGGEPTTPVEAEPIAVIAERAGRMLLKTLHEAGGVIKLSAAHEEVSAHHGNKACDEDGCRILNGWAGWLPHGGSKPQVAPVSRCSGRTAGSPLHTRSAGRGWRDSSRAAWSAPRSEGSPVRTCVISGTLAPTSR